MAVDPKYVEEVKEDEFDYDSVLEEFGIEASYQNDNSNGLDMTGYTQTTLRDMYNEDEYTGRPVISDIYTVEFKNKKTGETTINHKIDLVLFDDTYEDEKEALIFPCNLTTKNIDFDNNVVNDVYSSSGLYALAMGLMELKAPKISKAFNHLDVVGIKSLQKQVKEYDTITVKVVEKSFKKEGEENYYNSFKITEGEQ